MDRRVRAFIVLLFRDDSVFEEFIPYIDTNFEECVAFDPYLHDLYIKIRYIANESTRFAEGFADRVKKFEQTYNIVFDNAPVIHAFTQAYTRDRLCKLKSDIDKEKLRKLLV